MNLNASASFQEDSKLEEVISNHLFMIRILLNNPNSYYKNHDIYHIAMINPIIITIRDLCLNKYYYLQKNLSC